MKTDQDLIRDARKRMSEAASDYAAACNRPGLVTGYVFIFELQEPVGVPTCWWMTGSGAEPTTVNDEGLAPHRALGLIGYALRSIKKNVIS